MSLHVYFTTITSPQGSHGLIAVVISMKKRVGVDQGRPQGSHGLIAVVMRMPRQKVSEKATPQGSHGLIAVVIRVKANPGRRHNIAAREPRPDSRGNVTNNRRGGEAVIAAREPRPDSRGNRQIARLTS